MAREIDDFGLKAPCIYKYFNYLNNLNNAEAEAEAKALPVKEETVEVKVEPAAEEVDLRAPWRQPPPPPAPVPPWRRLIPSPPNYPPPCFVVSATVATGAERPPPWGYIYIYWYIYIYIKRDRYI